LDAPFAVIRVECGDALAVMRISDIGEALDWRLPAASWGSEKVIEMLSIQAAPRPIRCTPNSNWRLSDRRPADRARVRDGGGKLAGGGDVFV